MGREPSAPNDWVLGLDEAGRGSVLGPLVVGGFLAHATDLDQLAGIGVKDSKLLTPVRREELFRDLARLGRRASVVLAPATIDAYVRHGRLNDLEARTFARVVRRTRPSCTYVDACDTNARRFGDAVARWARVRPASVIARHKADRDLPIVAAASIVAKVVRDRAIARLAGELDQPIGSGYPSDLVTREFVRKTLEGPEAPRPWLRWSWSTTETLKPRGPSRTLESFPT